MLTNLLTSAMRLPPLVYVAVALGTVLYMKTRRSVPANIPPFPSRPYPIIGHILLMKSGASKLFRSFRKNSGDIVSMYMGSDLLVVINSYPLLKEAFVKHADNFSDRTESFLSRHTPMGTSGIIGNSGADWKEQRSVSLSILRSFGMGKNFMAEKINEEVAYFVDALADFKGQPTDIRILTNVSISNVICAILVGNRFEYDDTRFSKLIMLLNENVTLLGGLQILNSFPSLRFIPGDRFGARRVIENVAEIREHFCDKYIRENEGKEEEESSDNFIAAYLHEMNKKKKAGVSTYLDENSLNSVVSNLFLAGTETTSTTILWAMLFAVHYPDAQKKLYQEIVAEIGTDRLPTIQDKTNMHYTHAFVQETLRFGSIAPSSLAHLCNDHVEIGGYTIPKGTTVLGNIIGILHDEEVWGDPQVFRPERFIGKDNSMVALEEFVPFSLGRRYCLGESLARMELFLFLTRIFQRFEVQPEDPENLPTLESRFGGANAPHAFNVKFVERS